MNEFSFDPPKMVHSASKSRKFVLIAAIGTLLVVAIYFTNIRVTTFSTGRVQKQNIEFLRQLLNDEIFLSNVSNLRNNLIVTSDDAVGKDVEMAQSSTTTDWADIILSSESTPSTESSSSNYWIIKNFVENNKTRDKASFFIKWMETIKERIFDVESTSSVPISSTFASTSEETSDWISSSTESSHKNDAFKNLFDNKQVDLEGYQTHNDQPYAGIHASTSTSVAQQMDKIEDGVKASGDSTLNLKSPGVSGSGIRGSVDTVANDKDLFVSDAYNTNVHDKRLESDIQGADKHSAERFGNIGNVHEGTDELQNPTESHNMLLPLGNVEINKENLTTVENETDATNVLNREIDHDIQDEIHKVDPLIIPDDYQDSNMIDAKNTRVDADKRIIQSDFHDKINVEHPTNNQGDLDGEISGLNRLLITDMSGVNDKVEQSFGANQVEGENSKQSTISEKGIIAGALKGQADISDQIYNIDVKADVETAQKKDTLGNIAVSEYLDIVPWEKLKDIPPGTNCVNLQTMTSRVKICLHPLTRDPDISGLIQSRGTWEFKTMRDVQLALLEHKEAGLIDLGAGIGEYSLAAAALNRKVVAVEPLAEHILRLQMSVDLNQFSDRIILLKNVVSDQHGKVTVSPTAESINEINIVPTAGGNPGQNNEVEIVNSITLNDIAKVCPFSTAVLKIDVPGYVQKALSKSEALFRTINVTHVFTHWEPKDKMLCLFLIEFFSARGYSPYSELFGNRMLDAKQAFLWKDSVIVWRKDPQINNPTV